MAGLTRFFRRPRAALQALINLRWLLLAAALWAQGSASAVDNQPTESFLAIRINGIESGLNVIARRYPDQSIQMQLDDLQALRLQVPGAASIDAEGWVDLGSIAGLAFKVQESTQTLQLDSQADNFETTEIAAARVEAATPAPSALGAFINYDLNASNGAGQSSVDGLLEFGAFGAAGVLVGNALVRDLGGRPEWIRLDTTWTRDNPGNRSSVRIGDAFSSASNWSRSVRFAGVQWATNYATQPEFAPFPTRSIAGEAVLPSIVEVYVNDALRMRSEVPPGPFSIRDLPVISGSGVTRVVVRDLLGREQIISQAFYGSTRLLRAGLSDFSIELGFVRENYGLRSNDYGRALAVGTYRRGMSDQLTLSGHAELTEAQQTAGVGATWLPGVNGVVNASVAISQAERGGGGLLSVGYQHLGRRWSFGGNSQWASRDFSQLGQRLEAPAPRHISQAFVSVATPGGSVGLNYTVQDYRDRTDTELLSLNYATGIGQLGYLNITALRFFGSNSDTVVTASVTRPLGGRTSANSSYSWRENSQSGSLLVQRSVPIGTGLGYRLRTDQGDVSRYNAGLYANGPYGSYAFEVARSPGITSTRLGIDGGIALLGGDPYFSRRIDSSFAVIDVGGFEGVRVYADNQLIGSSNAHGRLLLPRLRAYQRNRLRIEQADLPLTAVVEDVRHVAVPWFRSGLLVNFPVRRSQSALLTVLLGNGEPVPAGALARLEHSGQEFLVGYRGELYVTDMDSRNQLTLSWPGGECLIEVSYPPTDQPLPLLGPFLCETSSP